MGTLISSFGAFNSFRVKIIFFLLLLTASCGPSARQPSKTPSDTLVVGVASVADFSKISRLIHRGLFRVNERFEWVPDLAASFEQKDPRHYTIHLKAGVLFHDGLPLTSNDVLFTIEKLRRADSRSPWKKVLDQIEEVSAPDPQTVQIALKEPNGTFLAALTVGILPKDRSPQIGTGPFAVERVGPEKVRLRRANQPESPSKIPFLEFHVIADEALRVLALKNGRVDALQNSVSPALMESLRRETRLKIQSTEGSQVVYLAFNLQETHLANPEVRKALAYALDIPSMIEEHLSGWGSPAQTLLPIAHWAYQSDVSTYPHTPQNVTVAKVALNRSGYFDMDGSGPRARFSLTLKTTTHKESLGLSRLIAKQWRSIGVDLKVVPEDKTIFLRDVAEGRYDLILMEGPEEGEALSEPDFLRDIYHRDDEKTMDQLTGSIAKALDREERREVYGWIQKIFSQDVPVIPLWYRKNVVVYSDRVQNVRLRPDGSFEWVVEAFKEENR